MIITGFAVAFIVIYLMTVVAVLLQIREQQTGYGDVIYSLGTVRTIVFLVACIWLLAGCANTTGLNTPDSSVNIRCDHMSTKVCDNRAGRITSCKCVNSNAMQQEINRVLRRF